MEEETELEITFQGIEYLFSITTV
jgi:hypothetical protein